MSLKGHTRIELTNVETGEVEVHEDDNMVTNALSKLLDTCGDFAISPMTEAMRGLHDESLVTRLTGGLMLFNQNIEENADIINAPAGVEVVGCGSKESYSGANVMAGSYNKEESGFTEEGGYKHVWDFSTSQANGEIACASLTTCAGGKITEGTFPFSSDYMYSVGSDKDDEILFVPTNYSGLSDLWKRVDLGTSIPNKAKEGVWILFADGINNRIIAPATFEEVNTYKHGGTTSTTYNDFKQSIFYKKSIDLSLFRFGFTNTSIFDSSFKSSLTKKIGTVTVEMPDELKAVFTQDLLDESKYYWMVDAVADEDYIYLLLKYSTINNDLSIGVQESIHIWRIDATTFESEYFKFTNRTDETLLYGVSGVAHQYNSAWYSFAINNGYIYCVGSRTKNNYLISLYNDADITILTFPDGSVVSQIPQAVYSIGKKFFIASVLSNYVCLILDTISKKVLYKNIASSYFANFTNTFCFRVLKAKGTHYSICAYGASGVNVPILRVIIDPTFLITINNLENPVTKTSAQTMKVTYVLSPA